MFSASLSLAAKDTPRTGKKHQGVLPTRGGVEIKNGWPYRKHLFFTPNASENASRTPGAPLRYRASIPYTRRPSPVPNATSAKRRKTLPAPNSSNCQKREDHCKKRSPECRREQENHSQKVCNATQSYSVPLGKASMPQSYSMPPESPTLHRYLNQKSRSAKLTGFLVVGRRIELLLRD